MGGGWGEGVRWPCYCCENTVQLADTAAAAAADVAAAAADDVDAASAASVYVTF